jgi:hypothetical protein
MVQSVTEVDSVMPKTICLARKPIWRIDFRHIGYMTQQYNISENILVEINQNDMAIGSSPYRLGKPDP